MVLFGTLVLWLRSPSGASVRLASYDFDAKVATLLGLIIVGDIPRSW